MRVSTNELAELLSPSLFADERVVVLEAAAEAGKDAVALIAAAAADLPPGTVLVVVHSGGGRAKALADQLQEARRRGPPVRQDHQGRRAGDFVRREFRALKVKVDDDTVTAMLDAVGSDIRELAAACSQLVADTDGTGRRRRGAPLSQRQGRGEGLRHRRQGGRRRRRRVRPRRCAGR